jgi:hypothetical protein
VPRDVYEPPTPARRGRRRARAAAAAFDRLLASCNNALGRVEIDARYLLGVGRRPILSRS